MRIYTRDRKQNKSLYKGVSVVSRTDCRHKLKHRKRTVMKSKIKDRLSIDEHPIIANGKRFGDWEMDLIMGKKNNGAILTLAERSVGFSMAKKLLNGRKSKAVANAVKSNPL